MITLTALLILAILAVIVTVITVVVGGFGILITFGDLIVAIVIIVWLVKFFTRHKKKEED